jgi:DNA helicase-2/ATP-dependent DNA helicase PcrA
MMTLIKQDLKFYTLFFGKGKIIDKVGKDDNLKLIILFDSGKWKKLLAKAINITVIE